MEPGSRIRPRLSTVMVHLLAWVAYLLIPMAFFDSPGGQKRYLVFGSFMLVLMALYFYYNSLVLIPRFLQKRKVWTYVGLLLAGYVVIGLLNVGFSLATADLIERRHPFSFRWSFTFPFYPMIIAFAVSSALRFSQEWFRNERQKKEMAAEKLASELAFLKSQVNPHFLFNILNNICSLARKKSDETESAIIKLAQIMRYMLQDSKDERVSLEKEVEYLNSYIELQKMRLAGTVDVTFNIEGDPSHCTIEPLLLIPFTENAFKHGVSYQEHSEISMHLACRDGSLDFTVINTVTPQAAEAKEQGHGIGLKNVRRRLDLLYPDSHKLTIKESDGRYRVDLNIRLKP